MITKIDDFQTNAIAFAIVQQALDDYKGLMIWDYNPKCRGAIKEDIQCNKKEIIEFLKGNLFANICPNIDGMELLERWKRKCEKEIPEIPRIWIRKKKYMIAQAWSGTIRIASKDGKIIYKDFSDKQLTKDDLKAILEREKDTIKQFLRDKARGGQKHDGEA